MGENSFSYSGSYWDDLDSTETVDVSWGNGQTNETNKIIWINEILNDWLNEWTNDSEWTIKWRNEWNILKQKFIN